MDFTKTKTFIAFIHKSKKNSYWIDGNDIFNEDSPKIYPYDSKEEKELANLIGFRNTCWSEVEDSKGEIVGVLLKVSSEHLPIISKEKAIELEKKIYGNTIYNEPKQKKEKVKDEPKVVLENIEIIEEPVQEHPKKKRGRPAKVQPKQIEIPLDKTEEKNYVFGEIENKVEEVLAKN